MTPTILPFWRAMLADPRRIGAIAPASRSLCNAVVDELMSSRPGHVIELGAGTGAITRALFGQRAHFDSLAVIERSPHLAQVLSHRFPGLTVHPVCASRLDTLVGEPPETLSVVSSLPFRSLPQEDHRRIEQEGTYPLPEAELDRFMLKLHMDYPAAHEELLMVRQVTRSPRTDMLDVQPLRVVMQPREVQALQRIASELPVDEQVLEYAVRLARATRTWPGLTLGAGPRASIALVRGGRARALLRGGEFVTPDDIRHCALAVLRHRVRLTPELDIEGLSVDQVLRQMFDQVPAPRL